MGEMATLIDGTPGSRPVADVSTVPLLRRVVESLATMRPGRYTVYLGRPDPAAVRAEWETEIALVRSARRAGASSPPSRVSWRVRIRNSWRCSRGLGPHPELPHAGEGKFERIGTS